MHFHLHHLEGGDHVHGGLPCARFRLNYQVEAYFSERDGRQLDRAGLEEACILQPSQDRLREKHFGKLLVLVVGGQHVGGPLLGVKVVSQLETVLGVGFGLELKKLKFLVKSKKKF